MSEKKSGHRSKLIVPLVVAIGSVIGAIAYLIANAYAQNGGSSGPNTIVIETFRGTHIVLSTIAIGLLFALVIVYARTYLSTRANFTLGIWIVLLALLLRFVFTYPILLNFAEGLPLLQNFLSPVSDAFTVIAFSLFLYLSLE